MSREHFWPEWSHKYLREMQLTDKHTIAKILSRENVTLGEHHGRAKGAYSFEWIALKTLVAEHSSDTYVTPQGPRTAFMVSRTIPASFRIMIGLHADPAWFGTGLQSAFNHACVSFDNEETARRPDQKCTDAYLQYGALARPRHEQRSARVRYG
jgi:hypothetical protein